MIILLFFSIFLCASVQNSSAVINQINPIEHARMPPVIHLDRYDACLLQNNGSGEYCSVKFDLVSDEPSDLYNLITEYSARRETHMNHTKLFYGICLTKTCDHIYKRNITAEREDTLEACLNETFWKDYKLKTRVTEVTCQTLHSKQELDSYDYIVAAFICILMVLNLLATLQDCYFGDESNAKGNDFLSCFSIIRNWRKLVAPAGEGPEPRLRSLVGFNGIKAICTIYIVAGHGIMPLAYDGETTHSLEQGLYQSTPFLVFITCGLLMVQWCFLVSSFLLFYNMEIYAETHKITWKMLPKAVLFRWLRFTPAYAVALAYTATWMRHFGNGPYFAEAVMAEANACRRDWWINLLYISNYMGEDLCFIQSWYISADFQLFFLGMLVYVMTSGYRRRLALALLFTVGVILPAVHTYIQDLDGMLLLTPENIHTIFENDRTFHNVYNKAHTNLPCYITSLAVSLCVYRLHKIGYQVPKTRWIRFLYWLTLPFGFFIGYLGSFMYAGDTSLFYRTLYAGMVKPLWAINGTFFIFGMVYQFEDLYRGVVEWRGWTVPSRLSYSFFLVHLIIVRLTTSIRTTTVDVSALHMCEMMTSTFMISFLAAIPFHLLVEAPFNQLVKLWMSPGSKPHKSDDKELTDANSDKTVLSNLKNEDFAKDFVVRRRMTQKLEE